MEDDVGFREFVEARLVRLSRVAYAESIGVEVPRLSPDGQGLLSSVVEVADPTQGMPGLEHGGDLVRVDLTTGRVRRVSLPYPARPGPPAPTPSPSAARAWWTELLGYLPEGVLLRLSTADGRGEALQVLDPATGAVGTVTELPARGSAVASVWPRGF